MAFWRNVLICSNLSYCYCFEKNRSFIAKVDLPSVSIDGKRWEVEVWNMLEDPAGGNEEVNFQSVPRYYEQKNRALMTVPHVSMFKDDDLIGIEPHDRMFPTGF